jgi:hypothetical protein
VITPHKPTSRYLSACPDLDYLRLADNLSGSLVIICQKPVSGELPVRRPAARMKRLFGGVVAAPKSYRAPVGIDLCSDFNEVAFRVAHDRFVVSVSSYPRISSYGHSGCAHGSYWTVNCIARTQRNRDVRHSWGLTRQVHKF